MSQAKYVTILFVPDGAETRRGFRVRQWVLRLAGILFVLVLLGIVIFFSAYSKVIARAAMTDKLRVENERLKRYYYKVQMLEENLNQTREIVSRLTKLAGIDYEFPEIPDDSTFFASLDKQPPAVIPRTSKVALSVPVGLPIQGFITQDFDVTDSEHYHPGVDIACAVGTPILTTAAGVVTFAGYDSTYGNMLVIQHNDSVTTIYGHNDTLLVKVGQHVPAGARVALSGNTGKSTAPHLHYEIRINNKPINPMDNTYDKENRYK